MVSNLFYFTERKSKMTDYLKRIQNHIGLKNQEP
eukprot:UN09562